MKREIKLPLLPERVHQRLRKRHEHQSGRLSNEGKQSNQTKTRRHGATEGRARTEEKNVVAQKISCSVRNKSSCVANPPSGPGVRRVRDKGPGRLLTAPWREEILPECPQK